MNDEKPRRGTPEFDEWIMQLAIKRAEEIYNTEVPEELLEKIGSGRMTAPLKANELDFEKTLAEDIAMDKAMNKAMEKQQKSSHLKVVSTNKTLKN